MTERIYLPDLDGQGGARLSDGEPHTVRIALAAGEEIPAHRHRDRDISPAAETDCRPLVVLAEQ